MSEVLEGDEWKHAPEPTPAAAARSMAQAKADADYATGRIGLADWRRIFDELSEPTKDAREAAVQRH